MDDLWELFWHFIFIAFILIPLAVFSVGFIYDIVLWSFKLEDSFSDLVCLWC